MHHNTSELKNLPHSPVTDVYSDMESIDSDSSGYLGEEEVPKARVEEDEGTLRW